MNQKLDRRKKYSRMVLKDSLIDLLKSKPITSITVKEICAQADINRSTFYEHYRDQMDLLGKIEEEIIADLTAYLNQYHYEESLQMTEKLLEYVASKYDICQTLLNENADHNFERRIMDVVRNFLAENWMTYSSVDASTLDYASTFAISGSIYVIKHWLSNNMDLSTKQLAQLINRFRLQG